MTIIFSDDEAQPAPTPTIEGVQSEDEIAILNWILETFPDEELDEEFDL